MSPVFGRRSAEPKLAVVGYDLKFARLLTDTLAAEHGFSVRSVETGSLHAFPEDAVREAVAWADTVLVEWCGPYVPRVAAMLNRRQHLVVRLHRFELHRGFCDALAPDAVDVIVTVNDHYRGLLHERTGWPTEQIAVIANAIETADLARPKSLSSATTMGMLGVASRRKRIDLVLDVLDAVRVSDPRITLSLKGHRPETLKWVMDDPDERAYLDVVGPRLAARLADGSVSWEEHGPDVAEWFTGIGYILSTSDDESFHLAPAEGMASGSIPVIRDWPGAETVYDGSWIHESTDAMAASVLAIAADEALRAQRAEAAKSEVRRLDVSVIAAQWAGLLLGL